MSAMPAVRAGVVAVMVVALTTATLVAGEPPIETEAPAAKPLPLIVTARPPDVGPSDGDTPANDGAAAAGGEGGCGDGPAGADPPPQETVRSVSATYAMTAADFW